MMTGKASAGILILISSALSSEWILDAGLVVMSVAFLICGILGEDGSHILRRTFMTPSEPDENRS